MAPRQEGHPLEAMAEVAMENSRSYPAACGVAEEMYSPALDL